MGDLVITIPTIFDWLTVLITGVPFWAAVGVMSIVTVVLAKAYRKRRGWC